MRNGLWRQAVLAVGFLGAMAAAPGVSRAADPAPAPTSPVVGGYERLKADAKADPVALGEVLMGELNCLQCHGAPGQQRIMTKGAPDLSAVGARATPQWLRAYLLSPHHVKPGATMPDLLHEVPPAEAQATADDLTHYLASLGGPMEPASEEGNALMVQQGRELFHTVGCVACHAPEKGYVSKVDKGAAESPRLARPEPKGMDPESIASSVPLGDLAGKTTVDQLEAFLLDPLKARPAGRMPSSNLGAGEARAIAVYLLRAQLDNPESAHAGPGRMSGLHYHYYESNNILTANAERLERSHFKSEGTIANFDPSVPGHRNQNFAVRFTGALHIPRDGDYRFYLKSDDGSRLYLDGRGIIDNDGVHPPSEKSAQVRLRAGDHPIVVTFFQAGSGYELSVEWQGPQIKREPIPNDALFHVGGRPMVPLDSAPFTIDPAKAAKGKAAFAALGCAACHAIGGETSKLTAKPLADLNADADTGCLGEHVAKGAPLYGLSADERSALKAAVAADKDAKTVASALAPGQWVEHAMGAMNCFACHNRGNVGGVTPGKADFFGMTGNFDLGDEGRFPPKLTGIGAKLLPTAIEQIVFNDNLHVRPWMATRMPSFSQKQLAPLPAMLEQADGAGSDQAPAFTEDSARAGRQLVGTHGLGCVNCHPVDGVHSLGIPSIDLATVHARLRPAWFHALMVNPPSKNPGTRMPAFWPDGKVAIKNVGGGTMDSQIDAVWAYVSLGKSMALPAGLQPAAGMELIPTDEPIVHRTFMADVGSRSIAVGFPEMVHCCFDANNIRLAKAWRGRFFDAKGQWTGRSTEHLGPLGTDIIDLPPGPSLALLDSPGAPWPSLKSNERNPVAHFKGYTLDEKWRPVFDYQLDAPGGELDVTEQPIPVLSPDKAILQRHFTVKAGAGVTPPKGLYFLAAQGASIEPGAGGWVVDGKITITVPAGEKPIVRESNKVKQLLVPAVFENGTATFSAQMAW